MVSEVPPQRQARDGENTQSTRRGGAPAEAALRPELRGLGLFLFGCTAVAIAAHGVMLHGVVQLSGERAAWAAGQSERDKLAERLGKDIRASQDRLNQLRAAAKAMEEELGSRQAEVAGLNAARRQLDEAREKLSAARGEMASAAAAKDEAEKAAAALQARKTALEGEIPVLQQQKSALLGEIAKARTELEGFKKDALALSAQAAEKVRLQSQIGDLQKQIRDLGAERDAAVQAVAALAQKKAELDNIENQLRKLHGEKWVLENALSEDTKQRESLRAELDKAKAALEVALREKADAEKAAAEAARRAAEADRNRRQAELQLQQVREDLAGATAELRLKETLIKQKEEELRRLEEGQAPLQGKPGGSSPSAAKAPAPQGGSKPPETGKAPDSTVKPSGPAAKPFGSSGGVPVPAGKPSPPAGKPPGKETAAESSASRGAAARPSSEPKDAPGKPDIPSRPGSSR